jgi:predicted alpha/beta hydrolase family esterase
MASTWGSELVDLGRCGHINADSGIDEWPRGLRLAATLGGHNPDRLVSELALRAALA